MNESAHTAVQDTKYVWCPKCGWWVPEGHGHG